ncbi:ciliary microtubule inner protein 1-like [Tubulanus polymorphus]|uniref:ciliary microtubule inner protein 1-like n=1 Tax=Tubulanus polymorphus TaxID=672921 RepID=UPI003DA2A68E
MGKHLNFVHNDEIWKDHVQTEMQSQIKKWPEKWGFLTEEYRKMNRILQGKPPTPRPSSGQKCTSTIPLKLPPINQRNVTRFPQTTAQEIGWKSTCPPKNFNKWGQTRRATRTGLLKMFKWPREGIE